MVSLEVVLSKTKAGQGCWTCKRRKIGCDRDLPECNNCKRTGRQCLGYGIRLVWPDQPDGRRQIQETVTDNVVYLPARSAKIYGRHFLNLTHEDLAAPQKTLSARQLVAKAAQLSRPSSLSPYPDMEEGEKQLMAYYEQRISRMISTIDTRNGFRIDLLPKALSQSFFASDALRNAILAVSSFHKSGSESALNYTAKALRSLSQSLAADEACAGIQVANTQLATSMMLCVYSVFDETEGKWHLHLKGAQTILRQLASFCKKNQFLYTWFLYHEVLGAFSQPYQKTPDDPAPFDLMQDSGFDKSLIIGSLGCSLEVLEVIHQTNLLRGDLLQDSKQDNITVADLEKYKRLETQLLNLKQEIDFRQNVDPEDADVCIRAERSRILLTAEFYRMAALLYLRRVSPVSSADAKATSFYTRQAFNSLTSLKVCTSPWPLFMLACEAETDDHRIAVLHALDQMDERRKIGNVLVLRTIIESFWKQQDVQAGNCRPGHFRWWDVANFNTAGPWFI